MLEAADEFTRRISDLYELLDLSKMSPLNKSNKMEMSFYALAATIHKNNHFQDQVTVGQDTPTISFYDLIKNALRKDTNGEELLKYEEVLVQGINREIMIELIKARVDVFAALAIKNLTDKRVLTIAPVEEDKLPEANKVTQATTASYLGASLGAKKFLLEIKVEKKLDPTLAGIFTKIGASDSRKEIIKSLLE